MTWNPITHPEEEVEVEDEEDDPEELVEVDELEDPEEPEEPEEPLIVVDVETVIPLDDPSVPEFTHWLY